MKTRTLVALAAGVGAYVLCSRLLVFSTVLSLFISLIIFILFRRILSFVIDRLAAAKNTVDAYPRDITKVVEEGVAKLKNIRNNTRKIDNNTVAEKIIEICRVGLDIFENIKIHPEDLQRAKPFINYYLDATDKIVSRYVELSRNSNNPEIRDSLDRVEAMLDQIQETYKKQLRYLLEDDVLDLNTEITVLERTMKLEG
ncbi:MAG: hypothetical protein CVV44_00780 [Spirochaetae bacterium HGW-Spirochaetae-1]|jgi:5-bromo-4-chloroindolyl phosphate hydrolysis protein|nr:MAG: hypothetical protein CVV44_00780 [Spirochaetae bacterium HGW-Spirochaetae-1]